MRREFSLAGYFVGIGALALVSWRTVCALMTPARAVIIFVDRYGESWFDVVSLVILWAIVLVGFYGLMRSKKKVPLTSDVE